MPVSITKPTDRCAQPALAADGALRPRDHRYFDRCCGALAAADGQAVGRSAQTAATPWGVVAHAWSVGSSAPHMPGQPWCMPRRSAGSHTRHMPGVLSRMPGELLGMPGRSANCAARHMPRRMAVGSDRAASAPNPPMQLTAFGAQDRGFCDVIPCRASAAADGQLVGRQPLLLYQPPATRYRATITRSNA